MKYTNKNIEKINNIYNDLISIGIKKFKEIKNYQDCQLDITYAAAIYYGGVYFGLLGSGASYLIPLLGQ